MGRLETWLISDDRGRSFPSSLIDTTAWRTIHHSRGQSSSVFAAKGLPVLFEQETFVSRSEILEVLQIPPLDALAVGESQPQVYPLLGAQLVELLNQIRQLPRRGVYASHPIGDRVLPVVQATLARLPGERRLAGAALFEYPVEDLTEPRVAPVFHTLAFPLHERRTFWRVATQSSTIICSSDTSLY
jgi:hypothetical protein